MSATLIRTCPLCGLRFDNLPILELHIREDHRRRGAGPATTAIRPVGPAGQAGDGYRPGLRPAARGRSALTPRDGGAGPPMWGMPGKRRRGIGYRLPWQRVTRSFSGSPARDESAAARGAGPATGAEPADGHGDLPGGAGQPGRRAGRARPAARPGRPAAVGGRPRARGRTGLRGRDRLGRLGPLVQRATARRFAPVPGTGRVEVHRHRHARRSVLPYQGHEHEPVLRDDRPDHGPALGGGHGGG